MNRFFSCHKINVRSALLPIFFASVMAATAIRCQAAAPSNDNLANAQVISGDSFSITGTMVDATQEGFEQTTDYLNLTYDVDLDASVWYTWTPSVSGLLHVNPSSNSTHKTPVLLFKGPGTPTSSTFVAGGTPSTNLFSANVTANQQYFFCVAIEKVAAHPFTVAATLTAQSAPTPTPTPAAAPVVTVSVKAPQAVRSTDTFGKIVLMLAPAPTTDLTVSYKTHGSAVNGVDYKMLGGSLIVPAGATKAKIKIKPLPSSKDAGTVGVKVIVTSGPGYTVGSPAKGKVKIVD